MSDRGRADAIGWTEPGRTTVELETGGWRTRRPVYVDAAAPCHAACPAGEPIPRWIACAGAGDLAGAWAAIREENPLPAVTGRVCAHPCERGCHRTMLDGAVAINALERFVGDWGLRHGTVARPPARAGHVAVVGGGPAGLACAYHVARAGVRVTILEAAARLGGLLRYGIPAYRLPRVVLDREIALIQALGVEVVTGCAVDAAAWRDLPTFDAIFVATGAPIPLPLRVPGAQSPRVIDGLSLLRRVNEGDRPALGARVVVVGGGSSAMDVARTARRLGAARVTVLALEARDAMPAVADEVAQALAEGVEIRHGIGVRAILDGHEGAAVVVAPARLERTAAGTIVPAFADGASTSVPLDTLVVAIGQRADPGVLPELDAENDLVAVTSCGGTSVPRVFAGGDLASRARTVAHALGAGARAGRAIVATLTGENPGASGGPASVVTPGQIGLHGFAPARRATRWERLPSARTASFTEVVDGLDPVTARAESGRCFRCGQCVRCDVCFDVCPDVAIARGEDGYEVAAAHCKGCGLCARECPRGALVMVDER